MLYAIVYLVHPKSSFLTHFFLGGFMDAQMLLGISFVLLIIGIAYTVLALRKDPNLRCITPAIPGDGPYVLQPPVRTEVTSIMHPTAPIPLVPPEPQWQIRCGCRIHQNSWYPVEGVKFHPDGLCEVSLKGTKIWKRIENVRKVTA